MTKVKSNDKPNRRRIPPYNVDESVIEESLRFIESEEMKNYLRGIKSVSLFDYCEIIVRSRADLERKAAALREIARIAHGDQELDKLEEDDRAGNMAEAGFAALEETRNASAGTVFLLREQFRKRRYSWFWDDVKEETTPFSSFEAARNHALELRHSYKNDDHIEDLDDRLWFGIEKWIPAEGGRMKETIDWTLSADGDIWFFDIEDTSDERLRFLESHGHHFGIFGWDLKLPVPFSVGDIVTIDCRPFFDVFHAVITTLGDNHDCCAVSFLYVTKRGKIDVAALKHNNFFHVLSPFSALYRAETFKGALPKRESPLEILSGTLKKSPELGETSWDFITDSDYRHTIDSGVPWKEFKAEYSL
jgi:hypothetical protein